MPAGGAPRAVDALQEIWWHPEQHRGGAGMAPIRGVGAEIYRTRHSSCLPDTDQNSMDIQGKGPACRMRADSGIPDSERRIGSGK